MQITVNKIYLGSFSLQPNRYYLCFFVCHILLTIEQLQMLNYWTGLIRTVLSLSPNLVVNLIPASVRIWNVRNQNGPQRTSVSITIKQNSQKIALCSASLYTQEDYRIFLYDLNAIIFPGVVSDISHNCKQGY